MNKRLRHILAAALCFTTCCMTTLAIGATPATPDGYITIDGHIQSRGVSVPVTLVTPATTTTSGSPLAILIHGHGGTRHEAGGYTRVAQGLAQYGIASIRMDFPGCGDSSESFADNNLTNMLADIGAAKAHAITTAKIDESRLALLGFSMGGRLAISLAANDNHYRAMGLWAPSVSNGAASMEKYLGGPETYARMKAQARSEGFAPFTTFWGQEQKLGYRWFTDLEASTPGDDLKNFHGALMVLYGDLDDVMPPPVAEAVITNALNAAPVVRHVIVGADHGLGLFDDDFARSEAAVRNTIEFFVEHL